MIKTGVNTKGQMFRGAPLLAEIITGVNFKDGIEVVEKLDEDVDAAWLSFTYTKFDCSSMLSVLNTITSFPSLLSVISSQYSQ